MMVAEAIPAHWKFADLVADLGDFAAPPGLEVSGLSLDSRHTQAGDLFFACAGAQVHGKVFIDNAIERGAAVVMWESPLIQCEQRAGVPIYGVPKLWQMIGPIAERFYGSPTREQFVVGVTGTNGKTSISQFIAQAFQVDGPCGVIGTLGNGLYGDLQYSTHTTPEAITLHALFAEMRDAGAHRVVMEVSSHGLEQGRAAGVCFDVAVFSNLSHEHLDYHGSMKNYARAKQRLFEAAGLKYAVINSDDHYGHQLLTSLPTTVRPISYGFESKGMTPSLLALDLQLDKHGLSMQIESDWGHGELDVPLLGGFNAANLLAALGVLLASGIGFDDALQRLSRVQPVPGRMQSYGGENGQVLVVVDYAHTPDALQQVLTALREHTAGKLWCVFGCGGDRDQSKRPLMAQTVESLADRIIVADDNPRSEKSEQIIADIMRGFNSAASVAVIADRAMAITEAIQSAAPEDTVLIAGKGHETYQLVGGQRLPFSDAQEVKKALAERGGHA